MFILNVVIVLRSHYESYSRSATASNSGSMDASGETEPLLLLRLRVKILLIFEPTWSCTYCSTGFPACFSTGIDSNLGHSHKNNDTSK